MIHDFQDRPYVLADGAPSPGCFDPLAAGNPAEERKQFALVLITMKHHCRLLTLATLLFAPIAALHAADAEPKEIERVVAVENVSPGPTSRSCCDGTIVAVIHNQPFHGQEEGDVECWASRDGRKWEKRSVITQHEPHTIRMNHAAGLARNGDLVVLCSGWTDVPTLDPSQAGEISR